MDYKKVFNLNFISFIIGSTVAHYTPNTRQGILIDVCALLLWAVLTIPLRYVIDNYKIVKR